MNRMVERLEPCPRGDHYPRAKFEDRALAGVGAPRLVPVLAFRGATCRPTVLPPAHGQKPQHLGRGGRAAVKIQWEDFDLWDR